MRLAPIDAPRIDRPIINLLAAANTPTGESVRWQEGTAYESRACGGVNNCDTCDPTKVAVVREGVESDDPAGRMVEAVAVYAETIYECMYLPGTVEEMRDRAAGSLDAELPRAVERELWSGDIARAAGYDNRYLISPDFVTDLTPGEGAVKPAAALGLLEDALGDRYSGVGLIHVNRHAQVYLPTVTRNGRILETRVGNRVVPGVGYPGTGPATVGDPDGQAPGDNEEWVYITPMVTVRVGAPEIPEEPWIDRDTNRAQIRARQPYEVSWDGCGAAFAILMQTVVEATP